MQLVDFVNVARKIGKGVVFRCPKWDGTADLLPLLVHLGDTKGVIDPKANEEYSEQKLDELSGPAPVEKYVTGEAPTFELPLYIADPDILPLLSPTGNGSGGYRRRRRVVEHTLVIFPEDLFIEADAEVAVAYTTAGGWTVGGNAATAAQLALIDQSLWFWRVHFGKTLPIYGADNAGEAMRSVPVTVMQDFTKPDGEQLYTLGNPVAKGILIDVA